MCWFEGGGDPLRGTPEPMAGLGLLAGSLTVHADGEPERLPVWLKSVREGLLPGGWAADDGVGLLFAGSAWRMSSAHIRARPRNASIALAGELVRHRLEPRAARRG